MEEKRPYLHFPDVDILDSDGFSRFVRHVQRARRAIHTPWEDPEMDLNTQLQPCAAGLLDALRTKCQCSNLIDISYPILRAAPHTNIYVSSIPYVLANEFFF